MIESFNSIFEHFTLNKIVRKILRLGTLEFCTFIRHKIPNLGV